MSGPDKKFQFDAAWPAHLSVGSVLVNDQGEVALLHFAADTEVGRRVGSSLFALMRRESLHDDETLEDAVVRGLREEMGAIATIEAFLDSLRVELDGTRHSGRRMHKTTLYFLARLVNIDPAQRDPNDEEREAVIEWHSLDETKRLFEEQATRLPDWPDLHEAQAIDWAEYYLANNSA